ncbi:MAG: N-acetyltransferase [Methanobrevibacter sp.]|nr:N-acetyltransferase [Methanobrevibacter sp.]
MIIRLESENDHSEVENLVRNSFWNIYRPGAYEHLIVHNLRNHPSFIKELAYVIEKDEKIIAHINYSKGEITFDNEKSKNAIVLGPVSVDKNCQNQGYGTELINYTLDLISETDIDYIFVVGDENYYSRFGFESASAYNLFLEGTDTDEENPFFMIKIFNDEINLKKGIFSNPDVFNVNQKDVDEFDKKFQYKEKITHENQL